MQHNAQVVHVVKNDLPLVEFTAVEPIPDIRRCPHPAISTVTPVEIICQEVDTVHPLAGQVIERANDGFTFVSLPCGITGQPVF